MARRSDTDPLIRQETTVNNPETPTDVLQSLASGQLARSGLMYRNVDVSSRRTITVTCESRTWVETLGGSTALIGPSSSGRVNLLDPAALFGVCYADPGQFSRFVGNEVAWGVPGTGHSMTWKKAR